MCLVADALNACRDAIESRLYIGRATWEALVERTQEHFDAGRCCDEQVYTFLLAASYAAAGAQGVTALERRLTGANVAMGDRLWFEVLPVPPRVREGNTNLDLALGAIQERSASGIELLSGGGSVCFCEMKWDSDLDCSTTNDPHRNQLVRVIENALCFQVNRACAERVFVTLVVPRRFHPEHTSVRSRLYQYLVEDYLDGANILRDIDGSRLEPRAHRTWTYPSDLRQRLDVLTVRCVAFEDLFEDLPASPVQDVVTEFWCRMSADRC